MYQDFNNYQYYGQQPYFQQQMSPQNRDVSQFVIINNENEVGTRLVPRDGTPVFYRIRDTNDVFQCAFINGQTCVTAYSLVPKIQNQSMNRTSVNQQEKPIQSQPVQQTQNMTIEEINQRLTHVEKYLQELTSGGNNAAIHSTTSTEQSRTVTPTVI